MTTNNPLVRYLNNKNIGAEIDIINEYTIANLPTPSSQQIGAGLNASGSLIQKTSTTGVYQNQDNMKIPSSGTVALVGCSVTQMNQIGAGLYDNRRQCDYGWANWLAHYIGGFDIVVNVAKGGATSGPLPFDQTNNVITQLPIALAANTDWIWMDFGILNDIQRSCTVSQTLDFIDKILVMISGKNVVAINCTPLEAPHINFTAERMAYMAAVNAGIAERVKPYKNIILIDAHKATVNPVGTGEAKTGYLQADDHIHYTHKMCRAIANAGKSAVSGKIIIVDTKSPNSNADVYNATSNPKRAQTNPKLIGTGGTNNIGTITGSVPTGCVLSKAGTSITGTSSIDSTNGGWTVSVTAVGAANDQLFMVPVQATDGFATAGDTVRGGFKLTGTGISNMLSIKAQLAVTIDGVSTVISTCLESDNSDGAHGQTTIDNTDMTIYVRLPSGVIPPGTLITGLKIVVIAVFSTPATATVKIEDVWLEKN